MDDFEEQIEAKYLFCVKYTYTIMKNVVHKIQLILHIGFFVLFAKVLKLESSDGFIAQ